MALLGFAVCICMMKSFDFLRINRSFSTTTFIIMGMLRKVGLGHTMRFCVVVTRISPRDFTVVHLYVYALILN